MYIVCQNDKYGFCKYGRKCDKIHFTDICEENEACIEKYCDKRHPILCYYFNHFKRCQFETFCMYRHFESKEKKFERGIARLTIEIVYFKNLNKELIDQIAMLIVLEKPNTSENEKIVGKKRNNSV